MGHKPDRTFLQDFEPGSLLEPPSSEIYIRHTRKGAWHHWSRDASENHHRLPRHAQHQGYCQRKQKAASVGEDVENLCTVGVDVNWCSHYGKQYWRLLKKKLKIEFPWSESISRSVMSDSLQSHGLACQAPLSMKFSRQEYWSGFSFPSLGGSSWPRNQSHISCFAGGFFTIWESLHDPTILLVDRYPKAVKTMTQIPALTAALLTRTRMW